MWTRGCACARFSKTGISRKSLGRPQSDLEEAGIHRRAEPACRIEPVNRGGRDRQPRPVCALEDAPRDGRLAQEGNRRRLIGQLCDQFQPDRLGHVKVGSAGQGRETVQSVDPALRRPTLPPSRPSSALVIQGGLPTTSSGPSCFPDQVFRQVEAEKVRLVDLHVDIACFVVTFQHRACRGAVAALNLDGLNLPGRAALCQQTRR